MTRRNFFLACVFTVWVVCLCQSLYLSYRVRVLGREVDQLLTSASPQSTAAWGTIEGFCTPDQLSDSGACELTEFVPDLPPLLCRSGLGDKVPAGLVQRADRDRRVAAALSNYASWRLVEFQACVLSGGVIP